MEGRSQDLSLTPQLAQTLQRTYGNRFVARLLQRSTPLQPVPGPLETPTAKGSTPDLQRVTLVRGEGGTGPFRLPGKGENIEHLPAVYTHNFDPEDLFELWSEIPRELQYDVLKDYPKRTRDQVFNYTVDGNGRTTEVNAVLFRSDVAGLSPIKGSGVSKQVKEALAQDPDWRDGDDGGHIVGRQFGGSGSAKKNVVMQNGEKNSEFATHEDEILRQILFHGTAKIRWTVRYYDDTNRPQDITISAEFPDGSKYEKSVDNPR